MQKYIQFSFKENAKSYEQLKHNSYYIKDLNRLKLNYKEFISIMNTIYKERTTDKINNIIDNIDLISSVLDVLK